VCGPKPTIPHPKGVNMHGKDHGYLLRKTAETQTKVHFTKFVKFTWESDELLWLGTRNVGNLYENCNQHPAIRQNFYAQKHGRTLQKLQSSWRNQTEFLCPITRNMVKLHENCKAH
jgi:hypothetical protein